MWIALSLVFAATAAGPGPAWYEHEAAAFRPQFRGLGREIPNCPWGFEGPLPRRARGIGCRAAPPGHAQPPKRPAERPKRASPRRSARHEFPTASEALKLGAAACHDLLRKHDVDFDTVPSGRYPGVGQPIRLNSALSGVTFEIPWSKNPRTDRHTVWDCRFAAAMLGPADWLARKGISQVHYFSVLRGGGAVRGRPRSQHNVGFALDLLAVGKAGAMHNVEDNFPKRRLRSCEDDRGVGRGKTAKTLTGWVCALHRHGWAHTVLTPDHDRAHHNHLHVDIKADPNADARAFVSFAGG